MTMRDAVSAVLGKLRPRKTATAWRELGGYSARFTAYAGKVYANDTCRACIRALADHTSKANCRIRDLSALEQLLNYRPNMYMNGADFLRKVRTMYEIHNTVFIYINRDDRGAVVGLYPIPDCMNEAVDVGGDLYMRFYLPNSTIFAASWDDLAVLRKDYSASDIWGDGNDAIINSLALLHTAGEGLENAIKSTANLRGIIKSNKAMLKPEDARKMRDDFVGDYLGMENKGGIAVLDGTLDYVPVTLQPTIANYKYIEDLRANIFRYFGMNEKAATGQLVGDEWEAFYEARIEPFLIALSQELTYKIFGLQSRAQGAGIVYESNRMQYMSTTAKLGLITLVDRGCLTPNELRAALNLAPIEGGDRALLRLDTAPVDAPQITSGGDDNADQD